MKEGVGKSFLYKEPFTEAGKGREEQSERVSLLE